jgi:hypothetical protein
MPGVSLGEAEDAAEVTLALEAAQGSFQRLIRTYLNLDHVWVGFLGLPLGAPHFGGKMGRPE